MEAFQKSTVVALAKTAGVTLSAADERRLSRKGIVTQTMAKVKNLAGGLNSVAAAAQTS